MAKLPYMPLYTGDVLGDTALQLSASSTRGGWLNMLCFLWDSPTRGEITDTPEHLAMLVTLTVTEWLQFVKDATRYGDPDEDFCIYRDNGNGTVTVINRRMVRDERKRKQTAERVRKHRSGNALSNAPVTPPEPRHIHIPKKKKKGITSKDSATGAAQPEIYITQKKRKLTGTMLSTFLRFWDEFDYKHDKARSADAWLDIAWPGDREGRNTLFVKIMKGTKMHRINRRFTVERGGTPPFGEKFITHKRWEDED